MRRIVIPSLWKHHTQLSTTHLKSPSPKHKRRFVPSCGSIEKVPLSAALRAKAAAGMTVEAAIVLPLFLFFFVNLGCAIEMIRLHGNLELALWNTGNKFCLYGYVAGSDDKIEKSGSWWDGLTGITLSYTYVKSEVVDYAGESYLEESPLTKGTAGLQFWESNIPLPDDTVDILMTYQVSPWIEIPAMFSFRMQNRYYGHLWTGYRIPGGREEGEKGTDVVYITEFASVYHESLDCTHLKLSIREVTLEEAKASRNGSGGRYQECTKCRGAPFAGTVFIGKEGDCYHYDRGCSGLKRTIHTIPRQQAQGYRPCSRCAVGK